MRSKSSIMWGEKRNHFKRQGTTYKKGAVGEAEAGNPPRGSERYKAKQGKKGHKLLLRQVGWGENEPRGDQANGIATT